MQRFSSGHHANSAEIISEPARESKVIESLSNRSEGTHYCREADGYRELISQELKRQGRPIAFLIVPMRRSSSYVGRVLAGKNILTQDLREKAFIALGIDPIRAHIAVAWIGESRRYQDLDVQHMGDYFREYLDEMTLVRQGCIQLVAKPAILREAAKRTIDMLLRHQDQVLATETQLLG